MAKCESIEEKQGSAPLEEIFDAVAAQSSGLILPPKLYLVPTPIGNLGDIGVRAAMVLNAVAEIYCEDTRNSLKLLNALHIKKPLHSCHEHNEEQRASELYRKVCSGMPIAYISDAGMPCISDPGERLIQHFIQNNAPFEILPGANAALLALIQSGLPTDKFYFCGFLPRSGADRNEIIEQLKAINSTIVIYESPLRVGATIAELHDKLGNRPAALVRELTKYYEETIRETLSELAAKYADNPPKGECIIVLAGSEKREETTERAEKLIEMLLDAGCSTGDAAKIASFSFEKPKNKMYKLAMDIMNK